MLVGRQLWWSPRPASCPKQECCQHQISSAEALPSSVLNTPKGRECTAALVNLCSAAPPYQWHGFASHPPRNWTRLCLLLVLPSIILGSIPFEQMYGLVELSPAGCVTRGRKASSLSLTQAACPRLQSTSTHGPAGTASLKLGAVNEVRLHQR